MRMRIETKKINKKNLYKGCRTAVLCIQAIYQKKREVNASDSLWENESSAFHAIIYKTEYC